MCLRSNRVTAWCSMRPTGEVPKSRKKAGAFLRSSTDELRFGNGAIRGDRIRRGDLIWRTHDPDIDKAARVYTEATSPLRKQAVKLRVTAREGDLLRTVWTVGAVKVTVG